MALLKPEVVKWRLERARACVGKQTPYKLGRGGYSNRPDAWKPGDPSDCSGFISYLLQTQRAPKPGRGFWIETTALYRDATGAQSTFKRLRDPEPGCIVVYPDAFLASLHRMGQGHVGLITRCEFDHDWQLWGIDCGIGNYRNFGDAIREHRLTYFETNPKAIICALVQDFA